MTVDKSDILVGILASNQMEKTLACVASVLASHAPPLDVLLLDNGSEDHIGATVKARFPTVTVKRLPTNAGCAGGRNAILRHFRDAGTWNYLLFLDNDATLDPDALNRLTERAAHLQQSGGVPLGGLGLHVTYRQNPTQLWCAGGARIDWPHAFFTATGRGGHVRDTYPDSRSLDTLTGGFMFLTRAAVEATGYFDENYRIYVEDTEWCWRMHNQGFALWSAPDARAVHDVSSALGMNSPEFYYYRTRNRLWFFLAHSPLPRWRTAGAVVASVLGHVVYPELRARRWPAVAAALRGLVHGFLPPRRNTLSAPAKRRSGMLLAVAGLALMLRLVYAFTWEDGALATQTPAGDAAQYVSIARALAAGEGFRMENGFRSYRPPLYPLFLAPFYRLARDPVPAILVAQCILGALTCVLALRLAAMLAGAGAGLVAGCICSLSFELISANGRLMTETLFALLLTGSLLALVHWRRRPSLATALGSGLLLGLAILTRTTVVLLPPALAAWMLLTHPWAHTVFRRRAPWQALGFLLATLLVLTPWVVRNYRWHGTLLMTSDTGKVLYGALSASATGGTGGEYTRDVDFVIPADIPPGSEAEVNRSLARAAWAEAVADPLHIVALAPRKLANMWRPWPAGSAELATTAAALFLFPTLFLVMLHAKSLCRRWRRGGPLLLACAYFVVLHVILMSEIRYRYPIMPSLMVLATVATCTEFARRRSAGYVLASARKCGSVPPMGSP